MWLNILPLGPCEPHHECSAVVLQFWIKYIYKGSTVQIKLFGRPNYNVLMFIWTFFSLIWRSKFTVIKVHQDDPVLSIWANLCCWLGRIGIYKYVPSTWDKLIHPNGRLDIIYVDHAYICDRTDYLDKSVMNICLVHI